ncbi:MAG: energy transducer TonB, partial [Pedobacter sp.]
GMVKIAFVVKKYGGLKNIEIIRDIGYGCAEEVIRVLKTTEKKWNPASNIGLVDQRVVFQIPFKLKD